MSQELVYTSAPQGLKVGSRGFCTVASTAGMPAALAERLESLSGYRHVFPPQDPQARNNPVAWSHLIVSLGGKCYHVVSRVADAGLDYSQRSNKLAHHVAFEPGELPLGGPAWCLAQPGFVRSTWNEQPQTLPAGRAVPNGDRPPAPCTAWQRATGDAGWAGVLAQSADQRQGAFIIFSPGTDLLPLMVEALALVPPARRWEVTFSTYVTKLPPGVDCRWRCVVAGSEEALAAQRTPGATVIDLTQPLGKAPSSQLVECARTGQTPPSHHAAPARAAMPMTLQAAESVLDAELLNDRRQIGPTPATPPPPALLDVPPPGSRAGLTYRMVWLAAGGVLALFLLLGGAAIGLPYFLMTAPAVATSGNDDAPKVDPEVVKARDEAQASIATIELKIKTLAESTLFEDLQQRRDKLLARQKELTDLDAAIEAALKSAEEALADSKFGESLQGAIERQKKKGVPEKEVAEDVKLHGEGQKRVDKLKAVQKSTDEQMQERARIAEELKKEVASVREDAKGLEPLAEELKAIVAQAGSLHNSLVGHASKDSEQIQPLVDTVSKHWNACEQRRTAISELQASIAGLADPPGFDEAKVKERLAAMKEPQEKLDGQVASLGKALESKQADLAKRRFFEGVKRAPAILAGAGLGAQDHSVALFAVNERFIDQLLLQIDGANAVTIKPNGKGMKRTWSIQIDGGNLAGIQELGTLSVREGNLVYSTPDVTKVKERLSRAVLTVKLDKEADFQQQVAFSASTKTGASPPLDLVKESDPRGAWVVRDETISFRTEPGEKVSLKIHHVDMPEPLLEWREGGHKREADVARVVAYMTGDFDKEILEKNDKAWRFRVELELRRFQGNWKFVESSLEANLPYLKPLKDGSQEMELDPEQMVHYFPYCTKFANERLVGHLSNRRTMALSVEDFKDRLRRRKSELSDLEPNQRNKKRREELEKSIASLEEKLHKAQSMVELLFPSPLVDPLVDQRASAEFLEKFCSQFKFHVEVKVHSDKNGERRVYVLGDIPEGKP